MLARPLTASKRKAGVSEESVLGLRESGIWFAFPSSSPTSDEGLRVGKEDVPIRQQARQSILEKESFILGGLSGIAVCIGRKGMLQIYTPHTCKEQPDF